MNRISLGIIAALVICGLSYFAYSNKVINTLEEENSVMAANEIVLKDTNKTNQETIATMQKQYADMKLRYDAMQADFAEIRSQRDEILSKIEKQDLVKMAKEDPGLLQEIINKSNREANRCFEILSGSAIKPNETNDECPWLFGDIKK
jgi:histidinol phosphatase-like enzyme